MGRTTFPKEFDMELQRAELLSVPPHTNKVFDPREFPTLVEAVSGKVRELLEVYPRIQALAATGNSGVPLMGAVSYVVGLPMIAVRKDKDQAHDLRRVNGWLGCEEYLIIDDLIDSGATLDSIVEKIDQHMDWISKWQGVETQHRPKPAAVLLYSVTVQSRWVTMHRGQRLELVAHTLEDRQGYRSVNETPAAKV